MPIKRFLIAASLSTFLAAAFRPVLFAKGGDVPAVQEVEGKQQLVLPDGLSDYLLQEFPTAQLPEESQFNPDMVSYYRSNLIGIHPAIAWGDFNGDKRRDYALLLITGQSKWGPVVELVVLNGEKKKNSFRSARLGEVYNFQDDYVSFHDGKLYKGRYKKGGWYINWDKKKSVYNTIKD
jgi:hypothetical protein